MKGKHNQRLNPFTTACNGLGAVSIQIVFDVASGVEVQFTRTTADGHPAFRATQSQPILLGTEGVDVKREDGRLHTNMVRDDGERPKRPITVFGDHHKGSCDFVPCGVRFDVNRARLLCTSPCAFGTRCLLRDTSAPSLCWHFGGTNKW